MSNIAIDLETTTWHKGSVFDKKNWVVCWSIANGEDALAWKADGNWISQIEDECENANLIIGFNFKFDAHWLHHHGLKLFNYPVWDVQLAEFILSNQTNKFPSLNDTCVKYGIPVKEDVVKTEYWEKGINTHEIPWDILRSYSAHDAAITLECYYAQLKLMTPAQVKLCKLQSKDMLILMEMEANGIPFDEQLCHLRAEEIDEKISTLKQYLTTIYPSVPINFGSNDHLSAFLYGGVVREEAKEHIGFYKSGAKIGQPKYKNIEIEHHLPKLYTPLKGSAMKKEGNYAVDEGTLKKLKGKKELVEKLLELSKLEKLNGTYYRGLVKLREEMDWLKGMLHGNFNQTTAATGRLSSSKPNLQNFASDLQDIFVSKYE